MSAPTLITASAIQDRLLALVEADDYFINAPGLPEGTSILTFDQGAPPSGVGSVAVCLDIAYEHLGDGALGDRGVGSDLKGVTFALIVYVGITTRDASLKLLCANLTAYIREAFLHYQFDATPGDDDQYWDRMALSLQIGRGEQSPTPSPTVYATDPHFHRSLSPITVWGNIRKT